MGVTNAVSTGLTRLLFFAYTDRVERTTKRLGIHSRLASAYWAVQSRFHDDVVDVTVGHCPARFGVSTVWEFYRFHDLMGEDVVIEDLLSELEDDDVFYDVGANVGMYTCFVAQRLPAEQVVAFEPHPENAATLRANLALSDADATIVERGLSDEAGSAGLAVGPDESGEGRHSIATSEEAESISIELVPGDELVSAGEVPAPTAMKIDVEGAELDALQGLGESIAEHCRLCYIEVHPDRIPDYGGTAEEVESFFRDLGFETESIHERNDDEYFLKAYRPELE